MPIPLIMANLSTVAASNSPAGSESPISTDDFHRAIQAILRHTNAKGLDIASAATIDLGTATGEFVDITGVTAITALGTVDTGIRRTVRFTGALTLTHNATSLILPSSASIITENGDCAEFISLGAGNWKCSNYVKQNGTVLSFLNNLPTLIGYGPGAGGAVTQLTSKATAVTLNKPTGQITMNAAALAAAARVAFTVNNTLVTTSDNIVVNVAGGSANPNDYILTARAIAGGFVVIVKNDGAASLSDALVIQYSLFKGAIA